MVYKGCNELSWCETVMCHNKKQFLFKIKQQKNNKSKAKKNMDLLFPLYWNVVWNLIWFIFFKTLICVIMANVKLKW